MDLIDKYLGEGKKFKVGEGVYIKNSNSIATIIQVFVDKKRKVVEYKTDDGMKDENELEKLLPKHQKISGVSLPPSVKKKLKLSEAKKSHSIPMECIECGHKFKKKITKSTIEVRCPKCKGYDTEVA